MQSTSRHAIVAVLALLAFGTSGGILAATDLHDLRGIEAIQGNAAAGEANATVCMACHGSDGHSVVPEFPNLAGQSPTYLYVQMLEYKHGRRENAVMQGQLAPMSDQQLRDLATWFAAMPGHHGDGADNTSRGGMLYLEGDSAKSIPACQGCHGANGLGPQPNAGSRMPGAAWATFPALAGQPAPFIVQQLKAYRDGTRGGTSNTAVMHGVSAHLDDTDIDALAGYIADL